MNILEHYVSKIWSEHKVEECQFGDLWEMVVDVNCYGAKEHKKHIYVDAEQYNDIKNKGYYMA